MSVVMRQSAALSFATERAMPAYPAVCGIKLKVKRKHFLYYYLTLIIFSSFAGKLSPTAASKFGPSITSSVL